MPASPDPADLVIESLTAATLVDLIGRLRPLLSPREAQVLDEHLKGHDDPEIAELKGVKTATVNTLSRRMAAKARRLL